MNSNGRAPTTVLTWPGADEAVQAQVGRVQQRAQRRHDRHVAAHAAEVPDALGLGALERQRGADGAVVSKPIAKKTTSRSGFERAIRSASSGE